MNLHTLPLHNYALSTSQMALLKKSLTMIAFGFLLAHMPFLQAIYKQLQIYC
jgi:hypothetical protein